jgi:hypothetical protein
VTELKLTTVFADEVILENTRSALDQFIVKVWVALLGFEGILSIAKEAGMYDVIG